MVNILNGIFRPTSNEPFYERKGAVAKSAEVRCDPKRTAKTTAAAGTLILAGIIRKQPKQM